MLGRGDSLGPRNPGRVEAAAAGALVIIYFDITVRNTFGRYAGLFFDESSHGAAIPSAGFGTSWGPAADIRVAHSVAKYKSVLRQIAFEHPYAAGIFADDQGPNWTGYPGMSAAMREQFYQAHVAHATALNEIMDEVGWRILTTNGVWDGRQNQTGGGTSGGFGYPNRNAHGCGLFDNFCQENINLDDFWRNYSGSTVPGGITPGQWRMADPAGRFGHFGLVQTDTQVQTLINDLTFHTGWVSKQGSASTHQTAPVPPTTTAHDLGLAESPSVPTVKPATSITLNADGTGAVALPQDDNRDFMFVNLRTNPWGTEQHPYFGEGAPKDAVLALDPGNAATSAFFDVKTTFLSVTNPPTEGLTYYLRVFTMAPGYSLDDPATSKSGDPLIAVKDFGPFTMPLQSTPAPSGCDDVIAERDALLAANASLTTQVATLQSEVTTLTSQNDSLNSQVTQLTTSVTDLTAQNTSLQGQVTSLTAQNASLVAQIAVLQEQLGDDEEPPGDGFPTAALRTITNWITQQRAEQSEVSQLVVSLRDWANSL